MTQFISASVRGLTLAFLMIGFSACTDRKSGDPGLMKSGASHGAVSSEGRSGDEKGAPTSPAESAAPATPNANTSLPAAPVKSDANRGATPPAPSENGKAYP